MLIDYRKIRKAFLQSPEIRTCVQPDKIEVVAEHRQIYVIVDDVHFQADDPEARRCFSVAEANTPSGYVFEEV